MQSGLLPILVPAALALAGTLVGLWLGQRRWATELRFKRRRAFDELRYKAYEELWTLVESAHIAIRTEQPDSARIRQLQQQINTFRLRTSVLLKTEDLELSNKYFDSIVKLAEVVAKAGSEELSEKFEQTNTFSESDVRKVQGLAEASETAERLRGVLIERVRAIMLETSYAVEPA